MDDQRKHAASIIHLYSQRAGTSATLLAQASPLNIGATSFLMSFMMLDLMHVLNPDAPNLKDIAKTVGGRITGWMAVMMVARSTLGLIPILGNLVSGAMTNSMFERVGWGIYAALVDGRDMQNLTEAEFKHYIEQGRQYRLEVKTIPADVQAQIDQLAENLRAESLDDDERAKLQAAYESLLEPYLAT